MSERTLLNPGIRSKRPAKRRTFFWVFFYGTLALVIGAWIIPTVAADHAARGRERFEAGDNHGAVEELTWALQRNPDDLTARYYLARAQLRAERRFDAEANFREVRKSPEFRKAASKHLIALLSEKKEKTEKKTEAEKEAEEKDFDDAAQIIAEEMAAAPNDAEWIEIRGMLALRRGDSEFAELKKVLVGDVGTDVAPWALTNIKKSRTLPSDAAFEANTEATVAELKNRYGLRDPAALKRAATKIRSHTVRAQADFLAATVRNPQAYRSLAELAQFAVEREDLQAAIESLRAIINMDASKVADAEARVYSKEHIRAVKMLSAELARAGRDAESLALLEGENQKKMLDAELEERFGRQLLKAGQFEKLKALSSSMLARDPKGAWGSFFRAAVASHEGEDQLAVDYYNRAQIQQPGNAEFNAALARAWAKIGAEAQADVHFKMALAWGLAGDADLNIDYAQLVAVQTNPLQAARFLEDRLRLYFNHPGASKDQQRILEEIRKHSATGGVGATSLADARRALDVNPENIFLKLNVARLERESGLLTIALPRCQQVTSQYPALADGWLLQAQILTDLGRSQEALPALDKAAALRADDPNIPWLRGRIDFKTGALDQARRSLTHALEINPKFAGIRLDLLEVELAAQDFSAARKHAEILLAEYPADARVQRGVGLARLAMNDLKSAVDPLRKALAAAPDDPHLKVSLARALLDAGATDEARTHLVDVAMSEKQSRGSRRAAAEWLSIGGFFKEAADAYTKLFQAATDEAERAELAGLAFWAHAASGDSTSALDELVRLMSTDRKLQAQRTFVVAAEKGKFHRESAAQADLLRAIDGHDADSLQAAKDAHLALKQWNKAVEDIDHLGRLKPELLPDLLIDRARAMIGLAKLTEAKEITDHASANPPKDAQRLVRLKLDLAIAAADAPGIESALLAVLAEVPGDTDSRIAAARALAAWD